MGEVSETVDEFVWNYRVIERDGVFAIHEAFYEGGELVGITSEPVCPQGDDLEELRGDIANFVKALRTPVLKFEDCPDAGKHFGKMVQEAILQGDKVEDWEELWIDKTMLLSESVLRRDWDTPEEDEAWRDL